jgi:hypothetical protein
MALRIPKKLADLRDVSALLPIDGQILARAAGVWTPTDAGYLPLTADGITPASGTFTVGGALKAASLQMSSAAALPLKGNMADGASAVSVVSDTPVTYTTTAKIHSFRNNTVEKAYTDKDGGYTALGASALILAPIIKATTNILSSLVRANDAASLGLRSDRNDNAAAPHIQLGTKVILTAAGGEVVGIYNDAGAFTNKIASIDKDGYVVSAGAPAGRRAAVPASAGAAGKPGDFAADASWAYFCTVANTWVRAAAATW